MERRQTIGILVTAAAVILLATLSVGTARAAGGIEQLIPQLATTPEQHKAVAAYYRGEAAEASAEAARHRHMAKTYNQGNYGRKMQMKEHCDRLAASYDALAKQYEELAAEHEASASK